MRIDPYREFVTEQLKWHPRLRSTRLHDMLMDGTRVTPNRRGYPGSVGGPDIKPLRLPDITRRPHSPLDLVETARSHLLSPFHVLH